MPTKLNREQGPDGVVGDVPACPDLAASHFLPQVPRVLILCSWSEDSSHKKGVGGWDHAAGVCTFPQPLSLKYNLQFWTKAQPGRDRREEDPHLRIRPHAFEFHEPSSSTISSWPDFVYLANTLSADDLCITFVCPISPVPKDI